MKSMNNKPGKEPDLDATVVRSNRNETIGSTLDEALSDFVMGLENDEEIVICDDGRYYQILASFNIEEITREEAAEIAGWNLEEVT